MTSKPRFSLRARLASFRYAFDGFKTLLAEQHNARLHLLATLLVFALAAMLELAAEKWLWLVLAVVLVWAAEAMNSALEYLANAAVPEQDPLIRKAKDVAASAVLITALGATIIGAVILLPPLLDLF